MDPFGLAAIRESADRKAEFQRLGEPEHVPADRYIALAEDSKGNIWARGDKHVIERPAGSTVFRDVSSDSHSIPGTARTPRSSKTEMAGFSRPHYQELQGGMAIAGMSSDQVLVCQTRISSRFSLITKASSGLAATVADYSSGWGTTSGNTGQRGREFAIQQFSAWP